MFQFLILEIVDNGVIGTEHSQGEGASRGMGAWGKQQAPGLHHTTTKMVKTNWTKELNKLATKCFRLSQPNKRGFTKRMHNVWKDIGVFQLSEQKLAGQVLAIKRNDWLSQKEIEEI